MWLRLQAQAKLLVSPQSNTGPAHPSVSRKNRDDWAQKFQRGVVSQFQAFRYSDLPTHHCGTVSGLEHGRQTDQQLFLWKGHCCWQNLGFLCPLQPNNNYRDRIWRKQKGGFKLAEKETQSADASRTVSPLHEESRALYKMRARSQESVVRN